jgi:hypothetical protein
MGLQARRWITVTAFAIFVPIYILIAMEFGARVIDTMDVPMHRVIQFAYYVVAGFAWTLPAMVLIKWMRRAPRPKPR